MFHALAMSDLAAPEAFAGNSEPAATFQVSGLMLRVLGDIVTKFGVSPELLFQGEAKTLSTREPVDERMPLPVYRTLLRRAITLTGDPALGLRCALQVSEAAFDVLTPLVAYVPTLRHALQETRQFHALAFEGVDMQLTEAAGVACLRWDFPRSDDDTDRSFAEFLTAGLLRMLRAFGGKPDDLQAVRFDYQRPTYHHVYTEAFDGKERFSQAFTGLEFASHVLDRPNPHANSVLQASVHALAEQRLERLARPADLIEQLRVYLQSQSAASIPDMTLAARRLGVSVRTLRRRLAEARLSYRELTQATQSARARTILRNPDFTLQSAASALGFNNVAAFHRAFKRWTGLTARAYRNTRGPKPVDRSGM